MLVSCFLMLLGLLMLLGFLVFSVLSVLSVLGVLGAPDALGTSFIAIFVVLSVPKYADLHFFSVAYRFNGIK